MACAPGPNTPCARARAAAAKAAVERRLADAAKITAAGAAAMAGIITKEQLASTVDQIEQAVEAKNIKRYGAP